MCGISGIYRSNGGDVIDLGALKRMTILMAHRGRDDEGYCLVNTAKHVISQYHGKDSSAAVRDLYPPLPTRKNADLGMGFRRLAIIELSENGHQPMLSSDGSCVIVFNGEIYNYVELRDELRALGHEFKGGSDTEVILAAWREWGEQCIRRFIGMWAFALWDQHQGCLFCSRDRFGIKPFYYHWDGEVLVWGSEIKSVLSATGSREIDALMLWRSMRINAMLAYGDGTFWKDIKSLQPGHNLIVKSGELRICPYYSLDPQAFERSTLSFSQAADRYRELFLDSVRLQMRSDVEVGSCLSGGLDSSAIVCSAARLTGHPLSTFSTYYGIDQDLDERYWISEVTKQSGTVSHLVSPKYDEAWDHLQEATWYNDLPVGSGCVSQYAVMKLASETGIKVLLDGQGCDEICAGYNHAHYRYFADLLRQGRIAGLVGQMKRYFSEKGSSQLLPVLTKTMLSALLDERQLYHLEFRFYRVEALNREFRRSALGQAGSNEGLLDGIVNLPSGKLSNFLFNMLGVTSLGTLLHYEDRMSMAHGVESRVPYLDHRLVEFCFTLPSEYKLHPPYNKYIHRRAVNDLVPPAVTNRVGKGIFGAPFYSHWLRQQLRPQVEDILYSREFRQRGIWDLPAIMSAWQAYQKGKVAHAEMIYNVLALELWYRKVFDVVSHGGIQ